MPLPLHISVPKFRTTARLAQWVMRVKPGCRLPAESERCFFRSKEGPEKVSNNLLKYADNVGEIGDELESLLLETHITSYLSKMSRRGVPIKERLLDRITDLNRLSRLAYSVGRLPESAESRITEPVLIVNYAEHVGPLPERMEALLASSADCTAKYLRILNRHSKPFSEPLLKALVGHDCHFMELSRLLKGRIPKYLEDSITTPRVALVYAKDVLKGRLPLHIEEILASEPDVAASYAFDIVRAYASPRLPDVLHNAVVLSNSDNSLIRQYIQEVERSSKEPS